MDIVFLLLFGYVLSRAALPELYLLLRRGVLADPAFWERNPQIMCRGILGIHTAPIRELLFWDALLLLLCMYLLARVVLPRQLLLLHSGVLGKQVLYEEDCGDFTGGAARDTFLLYKSRDGETVGMLRLVKRRFLLWERDAAYIRKEADSAKGTASVRLKAFSWQDIRQGFSGKRKLPYQDGQAVFTGFYCGFPGDEWEGAAKRAVCCGRVEREQPPEWFRKLEAEDFRFRQEDGAYLYFYADVPLQQMGTAEKGGRV